MKQLGQSITTTNKFNSWNQKEIKPNPRYKTQKNIMKMKERIKLLLQLNIRVRLQEIMSEKKKEIIITRGGCVVLPKQ